MTVIETLTPEQARIERRKVEKILRDRYDEGDRAVLRELSLSGAMPDEDVQHVERLRTLDFLLGE